jgi:hypothetical protein
VIPDRTCLRKVDARRLDEQIAKAQTAKEVITHGLACPHDDFTTCPKSASIVAARLAGQPLQEAHPH